MPTFRVKEQYLVTQWTYFNHVDKEHAAELVNDGRDLNEFKTEEIDREWQYISYRSLEEVENK